MPWEPTLVKQDGSPLGAPDAVRDTISRAFPATRWEWTPGGEDLLREMERYGVVSGEWRAAILQSPPRWHGVYDTEPVTVEFQLGGGEQVSCVIITSRGDHAEAQLRLQALARDAGWHLKDPG